jgi:hypothetical protein
MTRTVNIITAVYIGDASEYGYEKNKAYGLKLTQDDQFPIVLTGLKELSTEEDEPNKDLSIQLSRTCSVIGTRSGIQWEHSPRKREREEADCVFGT